MSARDRLRRPSLDRSAPVRRASTLFEPASADGENAGATEGLAGVMSRSVELGYRVVDEYIRQGRRARAARLSVAGNPSVLRGAPRARVFARARRGNQRDFAVTSPHRIASGV